MNGICFWLNSSMPVSIMLIQSLQIHAVQMSAMIIHILVATMQSVQTHAKHTLVHVLTVTPVTVTNVVMPTSVKSTMADVVQMLTALTNATETLVHAKKDSKSSTVNAFQNVMKTNAMTIHVMPMLHVLTSAKDTNANVKTVTLVTDTNAAMKINAKPVNTIAKVTQCVLINAMDTNASANQATVVTTAAMKTNVTRTMVTAVTTPSVSTSAMDTSANVLRDTQ